MSALKEIFTEPFYAGDVCGDMILATDSIAKFNEHHDDRGRFATGNGITAYHGTPHIVPEFSTKHIGSGEGAASYGYGLYFAENPATAESYRQALAGEKPIYRVDGKEVDPQAMKNWADKVAVMAWAKPDLYRPDKIAQKYYDEAATESLGEQQRDMIQSALDKYKGRVTFEEQPLGNTYQVRVDVKPEELLDWEKPLKEQSEQVQQAVRSLWKFSPNITGEGIYQIASQLRYLRNPRWNTPEKVGATFGSASVEQKNGSAELLKVGIPGLRYLDEGSRNGTSVYDAQQALDAAEKSGNKTSIKAAKQGLEDAWKLPDKKTYNLVIFDDSRVHITHVNGKELSKSESIAKTKQWQEELHPRGDGGRFAEVSGAGQTDDRPPQLQGISEADFAKGFSVSHHDYVRTDITKAEPFLIMNRPHMKVEGNFINSETGGKVGAFENLFGVDKDGKFYVDMVRVEILPGYQKEGIGVDFTNQCERFYKELGCSYVQLVANLTVGSLAWALNGYDFKDESEHEDVADFFGKKLMMEQKNGRLNEAQYVEAARRISSLTHSWEFATLPIQNYSEFGRHAMIEFGQVEKGWLGRKDLDKNSLGYKVGAAYQKLKLRRAGKS